MTKSRTSRRVTGLMAVVTVVAILGSGVWLIDKIVRAVTVIHNSEMRLLAMHHVCGLVGTYVERSGYTKWPRSWEDLLDRAEGGGFSSGWSPPMPRLQDLVIIEFDADLSVLQRQEPSEFTAVRPGSGGTKASVIGAVHGLLARIRGPVEWKEPDGGVAPSPQVR